MGRQAVQDESPSREVAAGMTAGQVGREPVPAAMLEFDAGQCRPERQEPELDLGRRPLIRQPQLLGAVLVAGGLQVMANRSGGSQTRTSPQVHCLPSVQVSYTRPPT